MTTEPAVGWRRLKHLEKVGSKSIRVAQWITGTLKSGKFASGNVQCSGVEGSQAYPMGGIRANSSGRFLRKSGFFENRIIAHISAPERASDLKICYGKRSMQRGRGVPWVTYGGYKSEF